MEPSYNEEGTEATIALFGDLNMEVAEELKIAFGEITGKGVYSIALDFTGVKIIKSVCIGLLVAMHKQVSAKGGSIRIVNTTPNVKKIFEITKLVSILNVT